MLDEIKSYMSLPNFILSNNTIYLKTKKDFSKYKIISKREEDEFTIYKYSEKER